MNRSGAASVVRVAVIGLGRRWAGRYRDALTRPGGRARVVALCDPVAHRAEAEADRVGCDAVEGLTPLLDRPDVEAVFLLDAPWFGLWPARAALERGKAVFSAIGHRATLDELAALGTASPRPLPAVSAELLGRFRPEMLRLRELLATELGPARRASIAALAGPRGATPPGDRPDPAPFDAAIGLLDRSRALALAGPAEARVVRDAERPGGWVRVVAQRFPDGASARLILRSGPGEDPDSDEGGGVRVAVEAERGRARIDRHGRLRWSAAGGPEVAEPRPAGSATALMVDHFLRRVRGEQSLAPDLDELRDLERLARIFFPR